MDQETLNENEEAKTAEVETETTEESNVENLEVKAEEKEEDFKEKFFYLAAEMDNLKKRQAREKESLLKYGSEKILSDLLDVIDNLERTVAAIKNDEDEKVKNIVVGVDMVINQFTETLTKHGLSMVEAEGKEFDPSFHEAMTQMESEDKKTNEVIEVFQKGYTLNGRLLRPAKVVVAK